MSKQLRAILSAPRNRDHRHSGDRSSTPPPTTFPRRLVTSSSGSLALCLGLFLVVSTIRLFTAIGKGTLAPWNPPQRLVVKGIYRHVRNPMIAGVPASFWARRSSSAHYRCLAGSPSSIIVNTIYIPLREEPGLVKRFGDDYLLYKRNVPRWIPRLTPWEGLSDPAEFRGGKSP